VFNWFKKKTKSIAPPLTVDMHSHLLPGLDDGVQTMEETYQIISYFFRQLGYTRLITTPHVMSDIYRNTSAEIIAKLKEVQAYLREKNSDMELHAAAEYYLDESLMKQVERNESLLTFGDRYLLFETNFLTEPFNLKEFIFQATSRGYKLILAHPERYLYLHRNFEKAEDLLNRGVLFQINISSLTGYYSKQAQSMASQLIDRGWVHMLGSDCHHMTHAALVKQALGNKYFQKALTLPLLNNTLA
jgi:protein-tyrosine phosphatase